MFVKKYILASATPFATPYYIFTGQFPGPVFMAVSGIHGAGAWTVLCGLTIRRTSCVGF